MSSATIASSNEPVPPKPNSVMRNGSSRRDRLKPDLAEPRLGRSSARPTLRPAHADDAEAEARHRDVDVGGDPVGPISMSPRSSSVITKSRTGSSELSVPMNIHSAMSVSSWTVPPIGS